MTWLDQVLDGMAGCNRTERIKEGWCIEPPRCARTSKESIWHRQRRACSPLTKTTNGFILMVRGGADGHSTEELSPSSHMIPW